MYYRVRARFREETAGEFQRILRDGTIAAQQPDGREIVDSMGRAIVQDDGSIEWSSVCYCEPPLRHERSTVYDRFFDGLTTEAVDGYQPHDGRPFLEHLDRLAAAQVQARKPAP